MIVKKLRGSASIIIYILHEAKILYHYLKKQMQTEESVICHS